MKTTQITQRTLIESYIRNNDATTASYMRIMNENFVIPFNKSLLLNEVALDANTINQIFQQAEQGMTGQGANRTMLGKGADVAGAVGGAAAAGAKAVGQGAADLAKKGAAGIKQLADKILNQNKANFEKSLPPADAGPVENFEQQATQAAEQIKDPNAKKSVMDLIKQGAKNPAVQTLVLAAVGGIATIVAGPAIAGLGLGMAATGALTGSVVGGLTGVVRGAMQGQGLKGALKQGAMGAGIGALGGGVAGAIAQAGQAYMQNKANAAADQSIDDKMAAGLPVAKVSVGAKTPEGDVVTGFGTGGHTGSQVELQRPDGSTYSISRQDFYDRTGQQGISSEPTGPVSMGASSDPMAGVSDPNAAAGGGMKNFDGSAMTNAQVKAAADRVAPVAGGDADPNKYYNSLSPEQQRATDDAVVAQARGNSNLVTPSTQSDGSYQQAAPIGRDGQPMKQVPMDEPAGGDYIPNQGRLKLNQWRQETGSPNAVREAIDARQTARRWILQESLGKQRSGYVLTDEAVYSILEGKIGDWFKKVGSNLTNKVTADKLKTAWTKAGMPNDSEAIANMLSNAGVGQTIVQDIFKKMGIPTSGQPAQASQGQAASEQPAAQAQAGKPAQAAGEPPAQAQAAGEPPAQAATPGQPGTQQQTVGQTQSSTQGAKDQGSTVGNNLKATGQSAASSIKGLQGAMQAGVGMGTAGQSLMTPKAGDGVQSVKDAQGKTHQYKKVGEKWINIADNKEVDPATAAMLNRQMKQGAAAKAANTEMGKNAQAQAGKPAQASQGQAQAQAQAGKPAQASQGQAQAGKLAQQPNTQNEKYPGLPAGIDAQRANDANAKVGLPPIYTQNPDGTWRETTQAKGTAPGMIPANQEQGQSPAQIRQQKQAAAAQSANAEMDKNAQAGAPGKDVMARMAKQLAPAEPAATPNFGQQQTGYSSIKMNAPTGIPNPIGQPQPTTGAKAIPVEKPAAEPAPAAQPTASAQADANKPGFLQSKIKGSQVPAAQPAAPAKPGFLQSATDKIAAKAAQPQMASIDFSAILARKAKIQL